MPSDKGKTQNPGLSALLEGLIDAGIEFILVGGLAAFESARGGAGDFDRKVVTAKPPGG
ncbi:MAG: hypothetical protein J7M30_16615 [Deltaproteobacteria bacterium]|nr:hypothetical protein [Deltaproteobacteria bacterium]